MKAYEAAVKYINDLQKFTSKNRLEHTAGCLKRLGDPQDSFKYIHVAGTNGKGSTCIFMERCLRSAGAKTGLFTSPHLVSINERFRINGRVIGQKKFTDAFKAIKKLSDDITSEGQYHPTYFEFLFLMAVYLFRKENVDIAVFETGLGGRLDATNALPEPEVTVITSVSFDHMEQLGNTLSMIAGEKAGIVKPGIPCVYDDCCDETGKAVKAVRKASGAEGARDIALGDNAPVVVGRERRAVSFTLPELYGETLFKVKSPALWQVRNASLAVTALSLLKEGLRPGIKDIKKGLASAVTAGRMQEAAKDIFIDGGHNPDGVLKCVSAAAEIAHGKPSCIVFAAMKDKDYPEMIGNIIRILSPELVIATCADTKRGEKAVTLAGCFRKLSEKEKPAGNKERMTEILQAEDPRDAFRMASEKKGDRTVFIMGSIYLAGYAVEYFKDGKRK